MKRAVLLLLLSCGRGDAQPPASAPAAAATSGAPAPDPLDEKLRHCPLTVETATAEVRDVDEGVEVTVRVAAAAQLEELERRVHHLEEYTATNGNAGGRHGTGKGGGHMQNCPIVTQKTFVRGERIELGYRIVVRAGDPSERDALRAETRRRLAALAHP